MNIKYETKMLELWELAGEVGALAETNPAYAAVYAQLSNALDVAESKGLITYDDTEELDNG